MTNLERISIYVTPELKSWFKTESEKMGVRMSSYISIILNDYRSGKEGSRALEYLKEASKEINTAEAKQAISLMSQLLEGRDPA